MRDRAFLGTGEETRRRAYRVSVAGPEHSRHTNRAAWLFVATLLAASATQPARADIHDPWDQVLKSYVDANGKVAYRQLQEKDAAVLDAYLATLATADPSPWSPAEQTAFWINAYNAAIVKAVLQGYSAEGIIGRKRLFSFYTVRVAGMDRTPEEIENGVLRKQFAEPRVHFAIVCASTSCPKLRAEAYRGATLDAQLDDQARAFLTDRSRNQFEPGAIRISHIFEWFAADFERASGSVLGFLRRYVSIEGQPKISYLDYDWTMNAQPGQRPG